MIQLKSSVKDYTLNLPTSISEITPEYLQKVTSHINVAEHYAIVALVCTAKLSEYCYMINNPKAKEPQVGITPIIVKFNVPADTKVPFEAGDTAIVANTELERAYHCKVPSAITSDKIADYIGSDKQLLTDIQTGKILVDDEHRVGNYYIKMLQFKIVPISSIHGAYKQLDSVVDPFIVKD